MKTNILLFVILITTTISCNSGQKSSLQYLEEAKNFYNDGKDSLAVITLTEGLKLEPNNFDLIYLRAFANHHYLKYQKAIEDYTKAIELKPQYDEAIYFRGVVKGKLGDIDGAIQDYTKAIEINPTNAVALWNRGILTMDSLGCADLLAAKKLDNSFPDSLIEKYCK